VFRGFSFMQFSLENRTVTLSVGEFAAFALGPVDASGGPQGIWRAQLGQHWHNELRKRTEQEFTVDGALRPDVFFEVVIEGRLIHRGWSLQLGGRIDQVVGETLREIKSVMRPLPAAEEELRADYPEYFRQLATYVVLSRLGSLSPQLSALNRSSRRAELIFVEASSGLSQTIALTPFDEALVHHQLDALVEFLNLRLRATERRRSLTFRPAFASLRAGQETIQADLAAAFPESQTQDPRPQSLLFEAPTGYGKTGCVLEFALGQLKTGRFERVIWLTGKSTGQLQVVNTLGQMVPPLERHVIRDIPFGSLAYWQVRNKSEHCVNHTFHCVRDGCHYLKDCAERWPGSGLARFYLDDHQPRDLDTLRAAGRDALICPYEITRAALAFNDVWIGDFNYVFAPDNQGLFFNQPGFDPGQTLLVVDEAHNLPSRVAGAHSHRATDTEARLLLAELERLMAPSTLVFAVEEWVKLLASLRPTESLDPALEAEIHDHVAKVANLVATQPLDYAALGPQRAETLWQFAALAAFLDDNRLTRLLWVAREGELEFTCVDAAPAIGEIINKFGATILMSATLQPFAEFAASCGLEVEPALRAGSAGAERELHPYKTLTAPTPWRAGAYEVAVDLRVSTTYRDRAGFHQTTAETIETLCEAAGAQRATANAQLSTLNSQPNTATRCVAVFFPSYAYAEAIQCALENKHSILRVALQPKLPDLTAQTAWIEENLAFSDALFLVLGSSFAEGIDLLGGRVTHAMVVGPALPEVNAVQKTRMDTLGGLGREASFRRVYQIPGLQKVNQALGRLVRAPGHKARVLLHCQRFADPTYASLLARDYQMYTEIASADALTDWLQRSN
jgi:Rad3-related DNA helicase